MARYRLLITVILLIFILSSCSKPAQKIIDNSIPESSKKQENVKQDDQKGQQEIEVVEPPKVDYEGLKVNESGKIMVLMYHGIGDKEDEWVRTAENFKKDLKALYDKGYRTISLNDYINNNINTPAGFTPVVITFDDSLLNQFNYIEKDDSFEIDPDCAVSIMQDFAKEHKDFGNAATFYVYYPIPFRQKDKIKEKFEYLVKNGFYIGNHSYTHEMLGKMDSSGIQKQLALNVKMTEQYLPGYKVNTLALPYGSRPKDEELRKLVVSGEYDGTGYTNDAVLLVGSNPAPAPQNKDFDSSAIPRIRASEMKTEGTGIYDWLKYFESHPSERYISDGNPETVAAPRSNEGKIAPEKLKGKNLIIY